MSRFLPRLIAVLVVLLIPWPVAFGQTSSPEQLADVLMGRDPNSRQIQQEENERERTRYLDIEHQKFLDKAWIDSAAKLKALVVLPPLPPVLADSHADFPAVVYPNLLVEYAGEIFFMPHGSLRLRRVLSSGQVRHLDHYRETRDRLVAALRGQLAETGALDSAARQSSLAAFAALQQSDLEKLEADAEALRAELAAVDTDAAVMKQRDSAETLKTAGLRNYLAALLAAQFYDGLSLEQRQLLTEVALETVRNGPDGDRPVAVFFLPSPARVRWPELPEAAASTLEAFDRLRKELKDALVSSVVYDQDKLAPAKRTAKYAALAARQAPQFAELHRLAEEVRPAVANLPYPEQPAPSGLPPDLVRQVGTAVAAKNLFHVTWSRRFQDLSRQFPPARFKLTIEKGQPFIQMFSMSEANTKAKGPGGALLLKLAEHKALIERDYAALSTELEAARAATERYRETLPGDEVPTVNQLLASLAQVHAREEIWRRFADYRTAMLTPGLTPAQRRLLFNAALRDLEKHRLATTE